MWMAAKPFAPVTRTLLPGAMVGMLFGFLGLGEGEGEVWRCERWAW